MRSAFTVLVALLLAGCGSSDVKKFSEDSGTDAHHDTVATDTGLDTGPDTIVDPSTDTVVGDTTVWDTAPADTGVDTASDPTVDCPPIPGGCVDYCADETGDFALDVGVQIERCTIAYGEDGCPYLDWSTEDCRPGSCDAFAFPPSCIEPVECSAAECRCPAGAVCSCSLMDCSVVCEGACIVTLSGLNGDVGCQDDSLCDVTCTGSNCTVSCAARSECRQTCGGMNCDLECHDADTCIQDCNSMSCNMICDASSTCEQDCTDATGSCFCDGCP